MKQIKLNVLNKITAFVNDLKPFLPVTDSCNICDNCSIARSQASWCIGNVASQPSFILEHLMYEIEKKTRHTIKLSHAR